MLLQKNLLFVGLDAWTPGPGDIPELTFQEQALVADASEMFAMKACSSNFGYAMPAGLLTPILCIGSRHI